MGNKLTSEHAPYPARLPQRYRRSDEWTSNVFGGFDGGSLLDSLDCFASRASLRN